MDWRRVWTRNWWPDVLGLGTGMGVSYLAGIVTGVDTVAITLAFTFVVVVASRAYAYRKEEERR